MRTLAPIASVLLLNLLPIASPAQQPAIDPFWIYSTPPSWHRFSADQFGTDPLNLVLLTPDGEYAELPPSSAPESTASRTWSSPASPCPASAAGARLTTTPSASQLTPQLRPPARPRSTRTRSSRADRATASQLPSSLLAKGWFRSPISPIRKTSAWPSTVPSPSPELPPEHLSLATGTEVRPPASHNDLLDRRSAHSAGLASAPIHPVLQLKEPSHPICINVVRHR